MGYRGDETLDVLPEHIFHPLNEDPMGPSVCHEHAIRAGQLRELPPLDLQQLGRSAIVAPAIPETKEAFYRCADGNQQADSPCSRRHHRTRSALELERHQ